MHDIRVSFTIFGGQLDRNSRDVEEHVDILPCGAAVELLSTSSPCFASVLAVL